MSTTRRCKRFHWILAGLTATAISLAAQTAPNRTPEINSESTQGSRDSVDDLREQVRELRAEVDKMRSDWKDDRTEITELRHELEQLLAATVPPKAATGNSVAGRFASDTQATSRSLENAVQGGPLETGRSQDESEQDPKDATQKTGHAPSVEEEYQLLAGKVDDQYQTKVESASKYRVRLSGIVLMNLASNQGRVDSIDLPVLAYATPAGSSSGSFGATLRQSEIGLETYGPTVAGARTSADLQLDLAGGFPSIPNGINSGLMRLRTATMRMDWTHTSVVVGQDSTFFSPNSPTSFASLAVPALSSAGNLWSWVPQIRVEHRIALGEGSSLLFQGGILDPVSGEVPNSTTYREAGPGEASRQPAYGARIAWTRDIFGQEFRVGVGGFYNRQNYGFGRNVDGWAGMTDVEVPFSHRLSFSGKFYRGAALGGLYGGIGRSVLFNGDPTLPVTQVQALNDIGGWAQLKYRAASKLEFNAAFGMDNPFAGDLKYFPDAQAYGDATLARNQVGFANMIYRPRSDLLFSAEYRHLKTYTTSSGAANAGQLNLMMGILF